MFTRRNLLAGAGLSALASPALAQAAYPDRPIRMLVPYAAGGGQDISARLLAEPIRAALGQPVVVENRAGASGMIAAQALAQAAPDGYTLMLGGAGETAVNQHLFRARMAYDPIRDLRPVMVVVKVPNVVMVNPQAPFSTVAGLVEYAEANPGKLSYSSSGIGNPQHLAGALLDHMAGIQTLHVPYRGSGAAVIDIASGQVQFGYNSLASGLALIRDGRIKAMAVTSKERMPQLPDAASVSEYAPLADYELVNYFGVFAPAATPEPIMERLHRVVSAAVQAPALRARFEEQGLLVQSMSLAQSRDFVRNESQKFGRIVEQANISVDG
ncbi:tripartite tricarboxylate transporter substrate binding protein [Roseomonas frigidaquae]|uniref:Tripartite tricarboxylate transporter substrate binding protein n=1 Tax=Falsiroseomonas frigidaquae TaxID=487318 RepID=A0ABX1F7D3_9PROT|nr:tripartite tricarboxylate transporter substrate binding protein [Falsiroseomonas frigidaquae]NKE48296.1 tripartite tricarboxylate transporter substrate binding protein [Falsiroseomonas frigidaquae]